MLLQLLVCLLLLNITAPAACQQFEDHPEWLLGLQHLLLQQHGEEQQQQPVTAARVQSSAHHSHHHPDGQLLRPRALPAAAAAAAARVAALQQQPDSSQEVTLGSVGRLYGVSQGHLRHMMQQDAGLLVSKQGLLVWACSGGSHTHHSHTSMDLTAASSTDCTTTTSFEATCQEGAGTDTEAATTQVTTLATLAPEATTASDGTPWLTQDLFTVVIPPSATHSDADVVHPPPSQPVPWTSPVLPIAPASSTATMQSTSATAAQEAPLDEDAPVVVQQPGPLPAPQHAFKLHSHHPGSVQHTIFLDFRGCSITDSYWNTATSKPLLTTQPYNLDGDPSSFSVQEQQAIVTIHQAVSQDFAPWGVDVTTEDPGADALVR